MRCGKWVSIPRVTPFYPDLAFSLPTPRGAPAVAGSVAVGVMDYHGGNDDRRRADEIHASYVEKMKHFILWLVDNGRHGTAVRDRCA